MDTHECWGGGGGGFLLYECIAVQLCIVAVISVCWPCLDSVCFTTGFLL